MTLTPAELAHELVPARRAARQALPLARRLAGLDDGEREDQHELRDVDDELPELDELHNRHRPRDVDELDDSGVGVAPFAPHRGADIGERDLRAAGEP